MLNLEELQMEKIRDFIKKHKMLFSIGAAVFIIGCAYFIGRQQGAVVDKQTEKSQPVEVPQDLLNNINALQNKLDISQQNAELLQGQLEKIQTGQKLPVANYYVTAPTTEKAATIVEQQIKDNDPTLPPAALEKTDRTVVSAITKDATGKELAPDQQKVDVYKINLRKDHRIKVGATVVDDKVYETVGYEQNRIEALAQLQGKDLKGATVTWTAVQW